MHPTLEDQQCSCEQWPLYENTAVNGLATQTKALDEAAVAGYLGLLQVVEQPAALANEKQQPAAAVVVVLVIL